MDEEFAFLDADVPAASAALSVVSARRGTAAAAEGLDARAGPSFELFVFVDIATTEVALDSANRFFTNYVITVCVGRPCVCHAVPCRAVRAA